MKSHHLLALGAWTLALALASLTASADKPDGDKSPHMKPGRPAAGHEGMREHGGNPDHEGMHHEGMHHEGMGEHGGPGAVEAGSAMPGDGPRPFRGDGFRNALRDLHEEMKAGKLSKDELKAKLAKLHETAGDRGKEHRRELSKRWGAALGTPSARTELEHHARRMAFLNRALVLAESDAKNKTQLAQRITKLTDKENERHVRAMERLQAMSPTPPARASSVEPAVSAPPAPGASAAGEVKGAEK